MIRNIILASFCIINIWGYSQIPLPSFDYIEESYTISVNDFDFDAYRETVNGTLSGPLFFACPILMDIDFKQLSKKSKSDNGYLYELNIESNNALGLSIYFSSLELGAGSYLTLTSAIDTGMIVRYTNENSRTFNFLSDVVLTDNVKITYFEPTGTELSDILIYRLNHSFSNPNGGFENSCPDQVDVKCSPEGDNWKKEINSAVMLAIDGVGFCSATIVNNTSEDGKPLILTSEHCYSAFYQFSGAEGEQIFFSKADQAFNTEIWLNYESPWCNGPQSVDHVSMKHATIRAEWTGTDFLLLELNNQIPTSYYPYYSGWDRSDLPDQPLGGVGIHQPAGDVKKISTHSRQLTNSTCMTSVPIRGSNPPANYPSNSNFFRVDFWDNTPNGHSKVEEGSSGSGLFNSNNRLVGNLFGSDCAIFNCTSKNGQRFNRTSQLSNYGKLSISWLGNGTPNTSLHSWLDPIGLVPHEYFGLRYIRYYTVNHNAWFTGDVVKFHDVNVLPGHDVVVTELQDRFEATGTLDIPAGVTFRVDKP